ncbi:murein hydrolase activator NlpD [Klebsiella pneumoniae]|uniref:murein hydrolase activator NlpD n=1 Tax=Klebsiella pneumoniae TaxID=573 RepID=UPI001FAC9DE0|nr:murein hydrolase activator NlpD [Klebsiella pneumoniae]MCI7871214.1 murein hydrolase activator NlpD [Klebsiella pneumoniae]MCI7902725.1 murein hydrolase activator NlpD [Klebsiella pneumoniae]HCA3757301.1 murein hydrolase activator NlpD [Klebsiella pneumoniae]
MSAGSTKFTVSRIAALSLVSLWLAGCTNTNNPPAPVSSAGGAASSSTNSGMLITPPPSGVKSAPQAQPIQPMQTQTIQPQPAQEPVQTVNGRIVYNRKYGDIPKGSYTGGSTYTVKRGDTLFYIAWVTGNDFRDLAQRNNIPAPYALNVGQVLQVGNASGQPITGENAVSQASARASGGATTSTTSAQKSTAVVASQPTITYSESSGEQSATKMLPNNKPATTTTTVVAPVTAPTTVSTTQPTASSTSTSSPISAWRWPTDGKVIENFSGAEGGNKGIDIAGSKGQAIVATADGRVVYAGNALRGYGNLIIIKHNDDYLSAYAHNDTMLVREQQEVKAGQKIATMGSTGTSSTRLHFEIRYKGKSVNPLQYLPQR